MLTPPRTKTKTRWSSPPAPGADLPREIVSAEQHLRQLGLPAFDGRRLLKPDRAVFHTPPVRGTECHSNDPFDLVVYTAHPDDESGYFGGTLSRLSHQSIQTGVVVLSHGEGGRLVVPDGSGHTKEDRSQDATTVAAIRDAETLSVAQRLNTELSYLYPARARADFEFTTALDRSLQHWEATLPGDGVADILLRLVDDIRQRRPRVIVTFSTENDPGLSGHGHHKAMGALVELAARLAASPAVGPGAPHQVEELLLLAPGDASAADCTVTVDPGDRLRLLSLYASQFDLGPLADRPAWMTQNQERLIRSWGSGSVSWLTRWLTDPVAADDAGRT